MDTLEELTRLSSSLPNEAILQWKANGKKVVGYFCSYIPEEILYAADILPVRLRAPGCEQTTSADVYMSHLNCTFVRSCLEFALEGKYQFLDGLIFTNSCDHVRRLYDILRVVRPTDSPVMCLLSVPHKADDEAVSWYKDELSMFRQKLEETLAVEVTQENLRRAIDVYNDTRGLLRALYDIRKDKAPPLSGAETLNVILAGQAIPKDRYNGLLRRLRNELDGRKGISNYRARLMLAGSGGCDNPDYIDVMEGLGGLVVTDTLCFGARYFWWSVETGNDLMTGLARSYLTRPSCPRMVEHAIERFGFVRQMANDFDVAGVVFQRIRYCDLWGGQLLLLQKQLKQLDIPLLSLEREYGLDNIGQLRTRIQAFLETIQVK